MVIVPSVNYLQKSMNFQGGTYRLCSQITLTDERKPAKNLESSLINNAQFSRSAHKCAKKKTFFCSEDFPVQPRI